MKINIFWLLLFLIVTWTGCSGDDVNNGNAETNNSASQDTGRDTWSGPADTGIGDTDSGDASKGDTAPAVDVYEQWSKVDGCVIDSISGPVILYMESADPQACVRVVFEESEAEGEYDIDVHSWWRSAAIRVSGGTCDGQFEDLSSGVAAEEATGSVKLKLDPLGPPDQIVEANLDILFAEKGGNPFGPVRARLSFTSEESIVLSSCF